MYEMGLASWQDWLGLAIGGVVVVVIAWQIAKTPPM
jgi:hypothetical protein